MTKLGQKYKKHVVFLQKGSFVYSCVTQITKKQFSNHLEYDHC